MRLPKGSPIVVTAQPDSLLMSLDELWDWVAAEPNMLGDDGESIVGFLQAERQQLASAEGMDLLTPESWIDLGVDVTRKVYVGIYPASDEDSEKMLDAVDASIRDEIGLNESTPVEDALTAAAVLSGDEPLKLYGGLSEKADDLDPLTGFRIVVPLSDSETFVTFVERLLTEVGYESLESDDTIAGDAEDGYIYGADGMDIGGVFLRVWEREATIDFLYDEFGASAPELGEGTRAERLNARLERVVEQFGQGRPDAPVPSGEPVAGISADQRGTANFAMLRGVQRALRNARSAGLEERDAHFTFNLMRAYESAKNWRLASDNLTGLSYSLFVGEPERLFRLGIDLFGEGRDEPLPVSKPALDIKLSGRSIAGSLDLEPMVDEEWQSWIGVENPLDAFDSFDSIDFDAGLFALSFPRSLAILFTNAEKVFEKSLPNWAEPLYDQRENLRRLEVATAGLEIQGLRLTPKVVGVLSLDESLGPDQREALGRSMAAALDNLSRRVSSVETRAKADDEQQSRAPLGQLGSATPEDDEESIESSPELEPLQRGQLSELKVGDSGDGTEREIVHYLWETEGPQPYLFFTYGLASQKAAAEHERLRKRPAQEGKTIMLFRTEPAALFSLMTFYEPEMFEPLDVGILAQRIGSLSFEVSPSLENSVQHIRYDFIVAEPPEVSPAR